MWQRKKTKWPPEENKKLTKNVCVSFATCLQDDEIAYYNAKDNVSCASSIPPVCSAPANTRRSRRTAASRSPSFSVFFFSSLQHGGCNLFFLPRFYFRGCYASNCAEPKWQKEKLLMEQTKFRLKFSRKGFYSLMRCFFIFFLFFSGLVRI